MSKEIVEAVSKYVISVISGFESGMYKMVFKMEESRTKLLSDKHQPFITIYRDLHESYFTSTFNSIINRDDEYVNKTFDNFKKLLNHSNQCLLNILANLIVSIHFNFDRNNLDCNNYNLYMMSINKEINNILSVIDLAKLFDHECNGIPDEKLIPISPNDHFIKIDLRMESNGVTKEINSFTLDNSDSE